MSKKYDFKDWEIQQFLGCDTPLQWIKKAVKNQEILLIDHANCEKKAASAAMSFMYRNLSAHTDFLSKMSKIAREELVHFEQVLGLLKKRNIAYRHISESRYVKSLRKHIRNSAEGWLVDTLIVGAFVEARSCERFGAIAPELDEELKKFYLGLMASEQRHFTAYLQFATEDILPHIKRFQVIEQDLVEHVDTEFRFYSGI